MHALIEDLVFSLFMSIFLFVFCNAIFSSNLDLEITPPTFFCLIGNFYGCNLPSLIEDWCLLFL